jgi:hypothetical protein
MTPKEKANQLLNVYLDVTKKSLSVEGWFYDVDNAKQCALIATDEVIIQWEYIDTYLSDLGGKLNTNLKYWYEVKQEIEKL